MNQLKTIFSILEIETQHTDKPDYFERIKEMKIRPFNGGYIINIEGDNFSETFIKELTTD